MRLSSFHFSVPALLIAIALCVLAWFPVHWMILAALGVVSFVLLAIGFARAMGKQENSYLALAVPPMALVTLLAAAAFFQEHQLRADARRPFMNAAPSDPVNRPSLLE
jgi:hypothetical protein